MRQVLFYDSVDDDALKFAVIASRHDGKWVFCRKKGRNTYEIPGGHRENGENIEATARRELYEETGSLENFVTIINEHNRGWYIEGRSFFTRFWVCECPMLFGIERLPSQTWCNCSVGYSQKVWEHVFECPVTVELLSSIKTGHDVCLMKVSPSRARWCQNEED